MVATPFKVEKKKTLKINFVDYPSELCDGIPEAL
jgi:hypothetical protein